MNKYILAHASEDLHEEPSGMDDVAAVNPAVFIGGAVIVAAIGFVIWKFLVEKK